MIAPSAICPYSQGAGPLVRALLLIIALQGLMIEGDFDQVWGPFLHLMYILVYGKWK